MRYIITQRCDKRYVGVRGCVTQGNCMCYREEKYKWFNTLEEAREFALKVLDNPVWERTYAKGVVICEAIINRHFTKDENGNPLKPYTTVDKGKEIEFVPFRQSYENWCRKYDEYYAQWRRGEIG